MAIFCRSSDYMLFVFKEFFIQQEFGSDLGICILNLQIV